MTNEEIWKNRDGISKQYPELKIRFHEIEPAMKRSKCPECTKRKRLNFIASMLKKMKHD